MGIKRTTRETRICYAEKGKAAREKILGMSCSETEADVATGGSVKGILWDPKGGWFHRVPDYTEKGFFDNCHVYHYNYFM